MLNAENKSNTNLLPPHYDLKAATKAWLATVLDGKLPTNQKTEG
jgi:hypothetical protein